MSTPIRLPDFITTVASGLEPCDDDGRLSPDLERQIDEHVRALTLARAMAEVSARSYVIS